MRSSRLPVRLIAGTLLLALTATTAAARQRTDLGTLSIQVRPPDADIFIDGEPWVGPEKTGTMAIQLPPGRHRVELRAPGRRPYFSEVTIREGETTPLNVALPQGPPMGASERPAPQSTPSSSGGIVQTSVTEDGFVIAPDVRITEIGHDTATLVGAYVGWVFAGQLLLGAGGYWQADTTSGLHLAYGGPVVEWRLFPQKTIGVNLHGLVGGGQLYADHGYYYGYGPNGRRAGAGYATPYYSYGYGDVFFVAEPEVQIVVRFGSSIRLQGGVGYRATSANGLNGASGSISVQFGR
jgi:hypothetical protein